MSQDSDAPAVDIPHLGRRLSRWLALQTMLGLGLVCMAVYVVAAMTFDQHQHETLDIKQQAVLHLMTESRNVHEPTGMAHMLDDFLTGLDELSLRITDFRGQVIYERKRLAPAGRTMQRGFEVVLADTGQTAFATLTLDRSGDDRRLSLLAWTLALAAVGGSLAVSLSGIWLVRLGLAPLRELTEQTRQLSAQDLQRRLDPSGQPQELRPLVAQFNTLLDQLSAAYRQMEAFNADVAHELNTPLTTLISSCELALRKPRSEAELREVLASNLEDLRRVAGIVADMLFLSHADRGQGARLAPVSSLAALAHEVIEFHEAALHEADLQVSVEGDAAAEVDVRLLRRALSNLMGNATRYAARGSTITVQIGARPCIRHSGAGDVALAVLNQGPAIDPAHLPRLFDRFYRADAARSQADRNHGLGLAIVAAIARMHGGRCFAESEGGFTRIGLELPDSPGPPRDSPA
ncbi:Sensor kinase CusS [Delftia tsuruhatensis]|uniref:heavy metal sensor histidine kinase n=1 Tax=Delftia tsuruhatensis TaxID=180282 RepID=UPI001E6A51A7|nr:heavy metal sensor histidine kinase [Delftia tsuruhatensis]CAB5676261.1 Sensor kinase CusS [Delftia tsuruhatensis]CAC9692780.1 Sensor kinase CusS [Delftia tsuruhatensis]